MKKIHDFFNRIQNEIYRAELRSEKADYRYERAKMEGLQLALDIYEKKFLKELCEDFKNKK
jgi:hypothetical protein